MPSLTMRRLSATVVASAVLAGGLAAGSGAASAAPAGSLRPVASVAAASTGSLDGVENLPLFDSKYGVLGAPLVLLSYVGGSYEQCNFAPYGCMIG
ncbi:hypothetical protein [Rhodococcus sp. NPDC058514]|uniref:hypothetical protein n=1 Tax=unclassified Rhodococcus (in: high G+C Gram-positive bacteria) TaxID=192944 RepID=UPI00364973B4